MSLEHFVERLLQVAPCYHDGMCILYMHHREVNDPPWGQNRKNLEESQKVTIKSFTFFNVYMKRYCII